MNFNFKAFLCFRQEKTRLNLISDVPMTHESAEDYIHFEESHLWVTFVANMAARGWMYSVVFFVIFLLGVNANKPKIKSGIKSTKDGKTVIVEGNNNAVSLGNEKEIKTALTRIQERLKSLEEKVSLLVSTKPGPSKLRYNFRYFNIISLVSILFTNRT